MTNYIFSKAESKTDLNQLAKLFNKVFEPEKVGELAESLTLHYPDMNYNNWYIARDNKSQNIVSGFVLIPWEWQMQGISLKIAEMGIVGTNEQHRGQDLFRNNNNTFEKDLIEFEYDLAVIQGIPGIYHRLGYHYAIEMENHIELPLTALPNSYNLKFRAANFNDISFLMHEEDKSRALLQISVVRSKEKWQYILSEGKSTEYGSEIFIIESNDKSYFVRILKQGFGNGLIISEASCDIPVSVINELMAFLKNKALKTKKPFIRLNLPGRHILIDYAKLYGAVARQPYAWQVKIVNYLSFIHKIKSLLEQRVKNSIYTGLSGTVALHLYTKQINMRWHNGQIIKVDEGITEATDFTLSIPEECLPALLLGHRTWKELQFNRPDVFPADQYLRLTTDEPSEKTGHLFSVLFPRINSWIYCQY